VRWGIVHAEAVAGQIEIRTVDSGVASACTTPP
jgi:hypothetical protein